MQDGPSSIEEEGLGDAQAREPPDVALNVVKHVYLLWRRPRPTAGSSSRSRGAAGRSTESTSPTQTVDKDRPLMYV